MAPDHDAAVHDELRVLIVPATRRDGEAAREVLGRAAIDCAVLRDLPALAGEVARGVGALILTDLAFAQPRIDTLLAALAAQPAWSDVPVVLLAASGDAAPYVDPIVARMTNVTLLDRPTSVRSLTSAVLAALRARRRQYQIRDQLDALRRADDALRTTDRRKDEFLATLAHELRNPLAPLRSALQLLERAGRADGQTAQLLATMDRQVRVMVRLIDDLLDIARISSGKFVLQRERVDLRAIAESAVEDAKPAIEAARHRFELTLPEAPVWVCGDATRLAQIVGNLLNNASKYTPNGGRIALALEADGDTASIRVSDDGVGIPPALVARVFDMFAQVNRTLDRSQGGLGIGLALVRRLMEMHGGTAGASSAGADRGSVFTVTLPTLHEAAAEPPAAAETVAAPPPAPGQRILVVDDNRDAADTLALVLRIEGHETRVAYNGAAALAAAEEFGPRVIFCDIGLPGMNGHEIAARLRADARQAATVLVAITGWGSEENKREARAAGFDYHLTKPVSSDALDDILRAVAG